MQGVKRWGGAAIAASCAVALAGTPAYADTGDRYGPRDPIQVVAEGLNGPFEISAGPGRALYVTEAEIGQVTAVDPVRRTTKPVITGVAGANGAVRIGSQFAVLTGEGGGPPDDAASLASRVAPAAVAPSAVAPDDFSASVLLARPGKAPTRLASLLANELKNNPDGQTQFGPDGIPTDSLSNPFYLINDRSGKGLVLVADGGGNAVLRVDRKGKVSNFFIPPVITTGACADVPNNDPEASKSHFLLDRLAAAYKASAVNSRLRLGPSDHSEVEKVATTSDVPINSTAKMLAHLPPTR